MNTFKHIGCVYIDYSGIANPEKYTIEAGTKSLKLAWPKRGVKFTLR